MRRPGFLGIVPAVMSTPSTVSPTRDRPSRRRAFSPKHESPSQVRRARRAHPFRLTDRDLELLGFVAAHRFVLAAHVHEWIGADRSVAYRRLGALVDAGLLRYERIFHAQSGIFQITNGGLAVIDSHLPRPTIDLRTYRHEIGVVWLWLAARAKAFGEVDSLLSEREMRSHDQRSDVDGTRFAATIDGYDRAGRPRVHHPDVLIIGPDRSQIALELELSMKGRQRLEQILLAYAIDQRIRQVVYLTDQAGVATAINQAVEQLNLRDRVVVRYFPGSPAARDQRPGSPWRAIRSEVFE